MYKLYMWYNWDFLEYDIKLKLIKRMHRNSETSKQQTSTGLKEMSAIEKNKCP